MGVLTILHHVTEFPVLHPVIRHPVILHHLLYLGTGELCLLPHCQGQATFKLALCHNPTPQFVMVPEELSGSDSILKHSYPYFLKDFIESSISSFLHKES